MKKLLTLFLFVVCGICRGQNLVPNPSFELYDTCPNNWAQIYHAIPWFQPKTYSGNVINSSSSDYFNSCSTNASIGVPFNGCGFQYARTGNAYAGIGLYAANGTREYLEIMLNDSMIAGDVYCVEYYVSSGIPNNIAIDNFHFYFSSDSLLDSNSIYTAINVIPSVVNPLGIFISDTLNWTKVSGNYTATGGEKFLTIGNLYDNAHTDTVNSGGSGMAAYYYVDDVSVMQCSVGITEQNENAKTIFPNPFEDKLNIVTKVNEQSQIILYDILSRKLLQETFTNSTTLNTAQFADGIYIYEVLNKKGTIAIGKLIKQ